MAGKAQFEAWQEGWQEKANTNKFKGNFEIVQTFSDGTKEVLLRFEYQSASALDFAGHVFTEALDCRSFKYLQVALFFGASFSGNALFSGASFSGDVLFSKASFSIYADFSEASFSGNAFFSEASFLGHAVFLKTVFNSASYFNKAIFNAGVNFDNAVFDNVGHFEQATFKGDMSEIPAFRGCKIDATRLEFSDETHFTQSDFTEDAIKNISFLKRLSDEHGQTDQALNFNAMELRAKRKFLSESLKPQSHQDAELLKSHMSWRVWIRFSNLFRDDFWFCVFTWFYEKFSDFGRSFTKPLFYLVFLFVISYLFGVVSAIENSPAKLAHARQAIFKELSTEYPYKNQTDMIPLSAYRAATEYSLYRSGNFLNFTDNDNNTKSVNMRLFGALIEPWWARLFGFVKGILTAVLLFLTALGLRNKYRVG